MAQWLLLIVEHCAGEAGATNARRHFYKPAQIHTQICAQNARNEDCVFAAGGAAVTTVERFVTVGVVFTEVEPILPFTVDHMDVKGNMSPLIYSLLAVWPVILSEIYRFSPIFDMQTHPAYLTGIKGRACVHTCVTWENVPRTQNTRPDKELLHSTNEHA